MTFKDVPPVFVFECRAAELSQHWELQVEVFQGLQDLLQHCILGWDQPGQGHRLLQPLIYLPLRPRHQKLAQETHFPVSCSKP